HGAKVHLHATLGVVVTGEVVETGEIEIGAEFAVDAREQVEIEGGGDAGGIVVGHAELMLGLLEVGGEQQGVAFEEHLPHLVEEALAGGTIEVADRASEKEDE